MAKFLTLRACSGVRIEILLASSVIPLRQASIERALKLGAYEHLALPAFCVNASGQVLSVNAAAAGMFAVPAEALIGRNLAEFLGYHGTRAFARRWARLWAAAQQPGGIRLTTRIPLRSGSRRSVLLSAGRFSLDQDAAAIITIAEAGGLREEARHLRRRDAFMRALDGLGSEALVVLTPERRVAQASPAFERLSGEALADLVGVPFDFVLDESARAEFRLACDAVMAAPECELAVQWRLRGAQGEAARQVEGRLINRLEHPRLHGLVVALIDVTPVERGRRRERESEARRLLYREQLLELAIQPKSDVAQALSRVLRSVSSMLGASTASFWRLSPDRRALNCEAMFECAGDRFLGEWVGVEIKSTIFPDYVGRLVGRQSVMVEDVRNERLTAPFTSDPTWQRVHAMLDVPVLVDGAVRGVLSLHQDAPRSWGEDEVSCVSTAALLVSLAIEAGQRREAESRIERLAWYDSLTGLPNRNLLRETLRERIANAEAGRRRLAVILIDLDRFKDVNDTLGHLVGDALIRSAAKVLRDAVGSAGVVARLGGDEFVVMTGEFRHRQELAHLAGRIAGALNRTDLVPNIDTQVSASIGVALFPEHGRDMSTLLKNADAAMYQAKRDGRNQFSFFNPVRFERAAREVRLGIELSKAIHEDAPQFFCEYQPHVEIDSGRVVGLEALIRWRHPVHGLLTPDRFIGVAEVTGLSERITRWVINEACAQISRWREACPGFDIPVSVNVAGRELGSSGLPLVVRNALLRHGVDASLLVLEITERTLVSEGEINNDVIAELCGLGVGLVLDDFGTGYSMLGYLRRLPVQAIKIDQSFVSGLPSDPDSQAIVHSIIAVARHFKLRIVAEGVERLEQAEFLRAAGCELAQGFYYARPLSADTILAFLQRGSTPH
ncbi:MAG: EAL domain-containing protein [Burkholderiaceae bacterium]